jgi:hypothetical protein
MGKLLTGRVPILGQQRFIVRPGKSEKQELKTTTLPHNFENTFPSDKQPTWIKRRRRKMEKKIDSAIEKDTFLSLFENLEPLKVIEDRIENTLKVCSNLEAIARLDLELIFRNYFSKSEQVKYRNDLDGYIRDRFKQLKSEQLCQQYKDAS